MERLLGFGASSVEGVGDSQGGFLKRLGQKLAAAGKPYECLNYGVGGNTTRDMLARLPQIRPHLPAKVIVLLGSNDFPRDVDWAPESRVPLDEFRRNVDKIFDELGSPSAIFVTSFAVCPPRTGIMPPTFQSYMEQALKSAAAHQMRIWDLHAESLRWDDRYLAEDGLHYNDAGHEMIAEHLLTMF
jgi:lysophospholipase L1-like esterase